MRTIKNLQVRYIRGARRVDVHNPEAAIVEISGPNGAGKSSALDAIEWGLRGKRALPEAPLHHGASKGSVQIDLGDITIRRSITEGNAARGGTVKISAADGSKWGQRDIEQIYGAWTFDPLAFARMRPDDQVSRIRELAGRDFCAVLEQLDEDITNAREQRAEAGRHERSFGRIPQPEPVEPVDVTAVLDEIKEAQRHNAVQAERQRAVEQYARQVERAREAYDVALANLARAKTDLDDLLADEVPEPASPIDVTDLERQVAEATDRNNRYADYLRAQGEFERWQTASRTHRKLEQVVRDLEEQRRQHLRTAQLPVPGLSWEGGKIALDGVPFEGLSTTEQLLLSARIGMAMSPELRVMLVREGGLIDGVKFHALRDLAAQEGYQVWMETAGAGHTPDALEIVGGELSNLPDEWSE